MTTPLNDPDLHALRGTLNGLGLQLEVLALAFRRQDQALHDKALAAAREAVAKLAERLAAGGGA